MSRPIDAVRDQISSDLVKNKNFILCEILDKDWTSLGINLKVRPLSESVLHAEEKKNDMKLEKPSFSAFCINKETIFDSFFIDKYYALVLNVIKDMPDTSIAIVIPKTFVDQFDKRNVSQNKGYIKKENVRED